jgi:hypothetical protein
MNLTIDTLKKSIQIDYIENLDNKISAKLIKTITDDELDILLSCCRSFNQIQEKVYSKFNIHLEIEIEYFGEIP